MYEVENNATIVIASLIKKYLEYDTMLYDTIKKFNVDSKAEYTA